MLTKNTYLLIVVLVTFTEKNNGKNCVKKIKNSDEVPIPLM